MARFNTSSGPQSGGSWQWGPEEGSCVAEGDTVGIARALYKLSEPVRVTSQPLDENSHATELRGYFSPPLPARGLGAPDFCAQHGLRLPYVAGAMANGISSAEMVEAMAKAGMLGFFGAAGLALPQIERNIVRLKALDEGERARAWGSNLIFNPVEKQLEAQTVDLYLRHGVRRVSASAYLDLTPEIVRYRVAGLRRGKDGRIAADNHVFAKVSRVELAEKFMRPPPANILEALVSSGRVSPQQAQWARTLPTASEITAEADSGGHTDHRPSLSQFPAMLATRDRISRELGYESPPRVGAAGGLGTPHAIAAAFAMGAAYVVTGSVNQACVEAGTSQAVRDMLCATGQADVTVAPAADMFEMGVTLQVLKRGTMFAMRAQKLYEAYRAHASLDSLPPATTAVIEGQIFRRSIDSVWSECRDYWSVRDPAQLTKAAENPRHQMALVFRWYLGSSSRWANAGVADRRLDYQIWCGPAMGSFNEWARDSVLEDSSARRVAFVATNLMVGAAVLTRAMGLRQQGLACTDRIAAEIRPRSWAHLEESLT